MHLALLHFIDCVCEYVFNKLKIFGNPALNKSIDTVFPIVFAHLVSLSHFDNFYYTSDIFVISDLLCYYCNYLGCHKLCSHKTANLIDKDVCSDCSVNWLFPHPSSQPPYSLRGNNIEIMPINNPTWLLRVQVKGRVTCLSL